MSAIEKTNALIRKDLPLSWLVPNVDNPNKMSKREFDLLCDNMEQMGITDPILVKKIKKKKYRIVGGHHRFEAAKYLGFETIPCTIVTDPEFDEEMENFQIVRHNVIKGKLDPQAFFDMYNKVSQKYDDKQLQDLFGFSEEEEFKKLIKQTAKQLPKERRQQFMDAAEELKTIDELSALLNRMFTNYGDTLKHGYMIVDYGGKKSYWLRSSKKTMKALDMVGDICIKEKRSMDDLVGEVVQLIANGKLNKTLKKIIKKTPEIELDGEVNFAPTLDNIEKRKK